MLHQRQIDAGGVRIALQNYTVDLFCLPVRDLISERTKIALSRAKANGKKLGRPKGVGKSRLDGRETEIRNLMEKGITRANIARILGVSWGTLSNFIRRSYLGDALYSGFSDTSSVLVSRIWEMHGSGASIRMPTMDLSMAWQTTG
jgi:hypothetical protein